MRYSPKQELSQERLHGLGSEESFVPHCLRRKWSPLGAARHGQSPQGERAGASESIEPSCGRTTKLTHDLAYRRMSPAGMERLGGERHRQSPQGERGSAEINRTFVSTHH